MEEELQEALQQMLVDTVGEATELHNNLAAGGWNMVAPGFFERSMSGNQSIHKEDAAFLVRHMPVGFARGDLKQGYSDSLQGALDMANDFAAGKTPSDDIGHLFEDLRNQQEQARSSGKTFTF